MKFIVTEDYEAMSRTAARVISGYVSSHPDCVLGLATGSTPIGLYRCLVEDYEAGALSFKDVTSFNLDEYRGLDPQHDQSYRYFMEHNLFSHVDIDPARTHVPDGACPDAAAATIQSAAIALPRRSPTRATQWPTQNAPHLAARQNGNVQERGDSISRELGSGTTGRGRLLPYPPQR